MTRFRKLVGLVGVLTAAMALVAPEARAQMFLPAIVNPNPADWVPDVGDGRILAITQVGDTIVAGGELSQVREAHKSTWYTRYNIFAFNASTGSISQTFVPVLDGAVNALEPAPDGIGVLVGGEFNSVNGVTQRKLVELNVSTGQQVATFNASANNKVLDMDLSGNRLFIAGNFTKIKGVDRQGLAALDPTTGALDPSVSFTFSVTRVNTPRVTQIAVSPDGSRLVALGNFQFVNGLSRSQIVMFDLTTTPVSIADWQTNAYPQVDANGNSWCSPSFDTYMRDVDFSPDGSYFVVVTTGAFRANRLCDTAARWETFTTGSGLQPTWVDWTGGDTTYSVAVTGTAVYVGGHMRWENNPYRGDTAGPGAVPREGIAALDPVNGLPFTWNPGRDPRGVGVFAAFVNGQGLWVGSDTDNIGSEFHGKIALMPLDGGEVVPPVVPYTLPNDFYNLESSSGNLVRRASDGVTFGQRTTLSTGIDWRQARGAFALNGILYTGWSDGWLYARTFDGTNLGPAVQVNLNGLDVQPGSQFLIPGTTTRVPAFTTDLASMTGMFYDNGRIYYTVNRPGNSQTNQANNNKLYYRYFTPESQVVGANLFVAASGGAVNWASVRGMTLANGYLYYALSNGTLNRIAWVNGAPSGSPTVIGGPNIDGYNWASQGFFVFPQTTDTIAPTAPGKPSGVSNTTDSIDLTWAASKDNLSSNITYRIYRDGNSTAVGTVTSSSTTTVSFTDTGLASGSTHTYTVDAVDGASNTSALSPVSDAITVLTPDTTPPTTPGKPTGVANGKTEIDLTWAASTDDGSTDITYRVYRDGNSTPVGSVTSSSTTTVSFADTGLAPGSTHTYTVDAQDGALNTSAMSESSDPITTGANIFADSFDSGDFSAWTSVTNLSIDTGNGAAAPPSALGSVSGQAGSAYVNLPGTYGNLCMSEAVNVTTLGGNSVVLMRLRSAAGTGIAKVFLGSTGTLFVRSDVAGVQRSSGVTLPSGWNTLELCGTVGSAGAWDLYLNGTKIVNAWVTDTGTTPVGRVQIGDDLAKTWTINFDDVVVDQTPG